MEELVKPKKETIHEPHYRYHDIIHYIEKLHNIDVRDCGGHFNKTINTIVKEEDKGKYLDFWHWLLDQYSDIQNDSYLSFEIKYFIDDEETPYWVKDILEKIYKEYPEDILDVYISW